MDYKVEEQEKNTYKITVSHTAEEVNEEKGNVLENLKEKVEVEGFREGKAPHSKIEEELDKNFLRGEILNHIISKDYREILKKEDLKPVANPRVNIQEWENYDQPLTYTAELAEKPDVEVGDYMEKIKEKAEGKDKIGQEEALEAVIETTKTEIPDLLIEEEAERMLSRMSQQIQQMGLTVDQYLQSKGKNMEELQKEYLTGAEKNLVAELALAEIIEKEEIEVTDEEIKEAIEANPDEESRKQLEKQENRWYIESILSKQKALNHLIKEATGQSPAEAQNKKQSEPETEIYTGK